MKRICSLLLALVMVFGLLPVTVLAVEDSEPNDTLATAQGFTMGDTINGEISENKDADWYKFTLNASGCTSFKVTSYMEHYSVWLYDDEGSEIWGDYGNAANSDTGMRADTYDIDLIEGTYYLKISGQHGSGYNVGYSSGSYMLTTSYINANADETEPNDTIRDAQQIPINGVFNGQCALNNEHDYFKFELPADGALSLTFASYMDYYSVWLFNSDGNEIWGDYGNYRDSEAISRKDTYTLHLVQGTYYLKVSGQHGSGYNVGYSNGNYTLTTAYIDAKVDETEPNDTIRDAQQIPINGVFNGQCALNNEHDYFKFELPADGALSLTFTSYMDHYSVWLFDSDGNEIWGDYGNGRDSEAISRKDTYTLHLVQGIYYLKVSGQHGSGYNVGYSNGNYTLTTAYIDAKVDETEPNDTMQKAQLVPLNRAFNGQCALNNEHDYFKIKLSVDGELSLTVTSYMDHYSVWLFDSDGNEIWGDYGNGRDSEAISRKDTYTLHLVQGIYYLKVSGQHGSGYNVGYSSGNYTFKLNTENPFDDVASDSYYYDPVLWALENGITTGASATTFNPGGDCLRAQVVTFLHRAEGNPAPTSTKNPFTDVKTSDYFYKPVLWAVEEGITTGVSATKFGSRNVCSRAAVVTFLWRAAGSPEPQSTSNPFTDVPADSYYEDAVLWAVENGITTGVDATHFGPANPCNRAQVVTFLYRAYN